MRRVSKYALKGFRRNEDFVNELKIESVLTKVLDCGIKCYYHFGSTGTGLLGSADILLR